MANWSNIWLSGTLLALAGCVSAAPQFVGPPAPGAPVEAVADDGGVKDEVELSEAQIDEADRELEAEAQDEGSDEDEDEADFVGLGEDGLDEGEGTDLSQDEGFEEGFCSDDIYAQYLMERHRVEHAGDRFEGPAAPKSSKKTARTRRRRRDDLRYFRNHSRHAALAYAHSVMAGPTPPYMGALPIVVNDKVDFWVHYFKTSGRGMFMRWLVRGESIKPQVQPLLQDSGVPLEFFYLAMIESGLSNSANSRARAMGTWQFMRGTAKLYGLKINHWVDERRDPIKSTLAAAEYLKELYNDLGDWYLAMAAYNAGPGRVRRAIRVNGSADFWKLCETRDLAKETKEYVPKVLAAILLAADPEAHGFHVHATEAPEVADVTVKVRKPVRLDELAGRLGVPIKTLRGWNPELLRNMTPPVRGGYELRLSSAYADRFAKLESKLTEAAVQGLGVHVVRSGDTFSHIAHKYGVSSRQLMELNPEVAASKLKPGSSIVVPAGELASTSQL